MSYVLNVFPQRSQRGTLPLTSRNRPRHSPQISRSSTLKSAHHLRSFEKKPGLVRATTGIESSDEGLSIFASVLVVFPKNCNAAESYQQSDIDRGWDN